MPRASWSPTALPRSDGRRFIVTGGNAGIGYFIAEQLASTGADVVLASRNPAKASLAGEAIRRRQPDASVEYLSLDLASLSSIADAARSLAAYPRVDGLVLNAGALAQRVRRDTADGHDAVFGTNHLGNFSLINLSLATFERTPGSRIVTMGSSAHRLGRIDADNLESETRNLSSFCSYATSKLAQMLTGFELDRRLRAQGSSVLSLVAHPGGAVDGLTPSRPPMFSPSRSERAKGLASFAVAQGKDHAAWPAVRALLDTRARGGDLWGPRFARIKGRPVREKVTGRLADRQLAAEIWSATEELLRNEHPAAV